MGHPKRTRSRFWLGFFLVLGGGTQGFGAALVLVQTAPGRVEIAATDASAGHAVAALAETTWQHMSEPFGLPPAFSSPVFVRLTPESQVAAEVFGVFVEAGGVVSVWIRWKEGQPPTGSQIVAAVTRGILARLAVHHHGANPRSAVPPWLEAAAVAWCETRSNPVALDQWRFDAERMDPPKLLRVLSEQKGDLPVPAAAALGLFAFLQSESGPNSESRQFLRLVLGGQSSLDALGVVFGDRYRDEATRELWWLTGWHHLRRVRTVPGLSAADSRHELQAMARFVVARDEVDALLPMVELLQYQHEPFVHAELQRRRAALGQLSLAVHPFYRNAAISLREAFDVAVRDSARRAAAAAQFERDWADGVQLEQASRTALDRLTP